ncbi:hypothetical protein [Solemya velesiana gill symbiont]|uniref:hypothetical protein n=1 Tax=Solemya velesiana gill symbiont TaxID=1918948 RepID=UPI0015609EE0|nr:hypothetical protein [Solemya velesiana gill symbiont]
MHRNNSYIMRDQVRGLIPAIMKYDVTREERRTETELHLLAVGAVTGIYLLIMALN